MFKYVTNFAITLFLIPITTGFATGQQSGAPPTAPSAAQLSSGQSPAQPPLTLTFADAMQRARANNPQLSAANTAAALAHQDLVQTRATLLPNVSYNMQALYTQGNGTRTNFPIFIANNAVHEYVAQGNVHQDLSVLAFAEYRRAAAAQAVARARAEIAARGLVVTVAQSYYGYLAAQRKYATAQRAFAEADRFFGISQKLERGGEVAHSDVIKAQIQFQQQERDLHDAELEMGRSRLELAVLLFADFNENFTIVDDFGPSDPLPSFDEVNAAGTKNNPDLRAALATLKQAKQETLVAWNGLLPAISVDYFYGLDAAHLSTGQDVTLPNNQIAHVSTLGSSVAATLHVPIWSWGSDYSKVKQANLQTKQAQVELSFAQRSLLANLRTFYNEAQIARSQLDSLRQSVELAAEGLRLTTLRYQAGESTVLEVVDAQNTLTAASKAYDDGQVRYRVGVANLQTLTGKF